jgi:hypothetical protein
MTRLIAACATVVLLTAFPAAQAPSAEDAAQAVTESWLKVVDAGNYGASWEEAASLFKSAVTQEQWTTAASGARAPLGSLTLRTLVSRELPPGPPPGAPAGKYAIVRYTTAFANAPKTHEMIVLIFDGDRGWRVAGYTVRPA